MKTKTMTAEEMREYIKDIEKQAREREEERRREERARMSERYEFAVAAIENGSGTDNDREFVRWYRLTPEERTREEREIVERTVQLNRQFAQAYAILVRNKVLRPSGEHFLRPISWRRQAIAKAAQYAVAK